MANDLLNPPETETAEEVSRQRGNTLPSAHSDSSHESHELDAFLGKAFEEKPIWTGLFESVHDLFFPPKLPPLELTSTPIPVVDKMAVKRSPVAVAISTAINIGLVALLLFAFRKQINSVLPPKLQLTNLDDIKPYIPTTPKSGHMGGGGGGGDHSVAPPIKGKLPELKKNPIVPPMVPVLKNPTIAINPAIDVQPIKLPDNPNMPTIGVSTSTNVVLASNGQGSRGGMGTGTGGGLGSGTGNGYGPGTGGNVGGGLRRVGDGVSAPKLVFAPDAEFSDEARRAKYEGVVLISVIVDALGNPQSISVKRPLGMGLDEKAIEAVKQYKFKPALYQKTGKPVPVQISIEVNFRLF